MVIEFLQPYLKKSDRRDNIIFSVFYKITTTLMYLIAIPLFIRARGEKEYSIIAIFLLIHGFVALIDAGFSYALGLRYMRAIATKNSIAKYIIDRGFSFYLSIAGIIFLLSIIYSKSMSNYFFLSPDHAVEMILYGLSISFLVMSSYFVVVLQAQEKISRINLHRFILDAVKSAGLLFVLFLSLNSHNYIYFVFTGSVLKLYLDYKSFSKITDFNPTFDYQELKNNFQLGWMSMIISVLSLLLFAGDKLLVIQKLSKDNFGSYSFAFDLNVRAYFLIYAVYSTIYPVLIKKHATQENVGRILLFGLVSIFSISIFYYLPLSFFSSEIVTFFVDKNLSADTYVLIRIFSLAAIAYMVFGLTETYLNSLGYPHMVLFSYAIGTITFFSSAFYLVENYQAMGGAYTFLAANLALCITGVVFSLLVYFKLFKAAKI